jgi:GT2 family glycosyltransferase
VDLCLRVRAAGWRIAFTPRAEVVHHLGASMAQATSRADLEYRRSHLRLYDKHNGPLARGALRAWLLARGAVAWGRAAAARLR